MFFWIFKKKTLKTLKNVTTSLVKQPLITQLPEVGTGNLSHGHQHQTSCSQVWTQETMQLRTVCDKCLYVPITSEFWGQNFYRYSANLILFVTFTLFWKVFSKKHKKSCFLKSEKKRTIRILEHWAYISVITETLVQVLVMWQLETRQDAQLPQRGFRSAIPGVHHNPLHWNLKDTEMTTTNPNTKP